MFKLIVCCTVVLGSTIAFGKNYKTVVDYKFYNETNNEDLNAFPRLCMTKPGNFVMLQSFRLSGIRLTTYDSFYKKMYSKQITGDIQNLNTRNSIIISEYYSDDVMIQALKRNPLY